MSGLGEIDEHLALVVAAPGPGDEAGGFEALQQRREGRGIELEQGPDLSHRERRLTPQRQHDQILGVGESHGLQQRPVDGEDAARGDDQRKAHLALQGQGVLAAAGDRGGPLIHGHECSLQFGQLTIGAADPLGGLLRCSIEGTIRSDTI